MNSSAPVARVLAKTNALLLDFDGPVCAVFASTPNWSSANRLREVLACHGAAYPRRIASEDDPLEVLRFAATLGDRQITAEVDDELRRIELEAVAGATPTPHAHEVMTAASVAGRPLAIVSNNSAPAVQAYLSTCHLSDYVGCVVGRAYAEPSRMKPNPESIHAALECLKVQPGSAVLVGDSVTDIDASRAAGVRTIGYANRAGKRERLTAAGADAVVEGVEGMAQLARLLRAEAATAAGR